MGAHFGAIAIKTDKIDEVLKITDEYYHQHGLSLAEVSIGNIESKYTKVKVKDIIEFQQEYRPKKRNADMFVDFDIYFNLQENKDWVVFEYDLKAGKNALNIDNGLSRLLSKNLFTEVVEYYKYDVVNALEMRKIVDGEIVDEFSIDDLEEVKEAQGYFEKFKNEKYIDTSKMQEEVEFPYLEKNGLSFKAEELELYNVKSWRRFYLIEAEENLNKYLSRFNVTFEGIKSAYNIMINSLRSMQEHERKKNEGA